MIKINGSKVNINYFPDGTFLLKEDVGAYILNNNTRTATFNWHFENNAELVALQFLAKHFKNNGMNIRLIMPYIPNARQDRVKNTEDVFTLKYFAEIINSLGFADVTVLDPHSNVSTALLDRIITRSPREYIYEAIKKIDKDHTELILYFPDDGSMKRYANMFPKYKYVYGQKTRNWETGEILGLDIITNGLDLSGKTILMIDDIISYGGSYFYSAQTLKEFSVDKIYAYATHTENSVLNKEKGTFIKSLENGTVERLFTTDSLYNGQHEKIEVIRV